MSLTVEGDWSLVFQLIYGIYMVFIIEMIAKKRMRCSFNFIATQKERINLCLKLSINLCLQKWPKLNLVSNLMINDKQDKFQLRFVKYGMIWFLEPRIYLIWNYSSHLFRVLKVSSWSIWLYKRCYMYLCVEKISALVEVI